MSYRFRIAVWVVLSCVFLVGVMIFTGYRQLEEELREGGSDPSHPKIQGWELHNSFRENEIEEILGEMTKAWLWTAVPLIGLSLGAGLLLARRSMQPVHEINRQISEMRPDSLHGGITIPEADPVIEELADHLNSLLNRAGVAYHEMSDFSARVAHEIRTPLMLLRMRLENAPPGVEVSFQEELQDELSRLSRFVERSLLSVKAEQGVLKIVPVTLNLSDLVRDVSDGYQFLAAESNLVMTLELAEHLQIDADSDLLRQAIHGLMENALRYAKSRIFVTCFIDNDVPVLVIRNDKDAKTMATAGLGLGLRLVRGICESSAFVCEIEKDECEFTAKIRFGPPPDCDS